MKTDTDLSLLWKARIIAGSCGVSVVTDPQATSFSVDRSGKITIPVLSAESPDFGEIAAGGVLLEALRFRHSNFDVLRDISELERTFLVIFEGYRVEWVGINAWAGAFDQLHALWKGLYRRGKVSRFDPAKDDILYMLAVMCLSHSKAHMYDIEEASQDLTDTSLRLEALTAPEAVQVVREALSLLPQMRSTKDALEVARRVLVPFVSPSDVNKQVPDMQPLPGSDSGSADPADGGPNDQATEPESDSGQQPGDKGSVHEPSRDDLVEEAGTSDSADGAQSANAAPGDRPADGSDSDPSGGPGERYGAGTGTQPCSGQTAPDDDLIEESGAGPGGDAEGGQAAESNAPPERIDCSSPAVSGAMEEGVDVDPLAMIRREIADLVAEHYKLQTAPSRPMQVEAVAATDSVSAEAMLRRVTRATIGLRSQLEHVLRSIARETEVRGTVGRVDPRRLWRLRVGDTRIFTRTMKGISKSVHIHLLGDASSSMVDNNRIQAMREWMVSLGLAVETVNGVKCSWSAFKSAGRSAQLISLKSLNEASQAASPRVVAIQPGGSTPLAEALRAMRPQLRAETADRQILMIGTDGEPDEMQWARDEIAAIREEGVEVVVFGIQKSARALDKDALLIMNLNELAPVLFRKLETMLAEALAEAA